MLLIADLITAPIACALGEKSDERLYHAVFGIQSKRGVIRVFRDEELRVGHSAQLSLDDAGRKVGAPAQPRLHRLHDHYRTSHAAERAEAVCADDRGPLRLDGDLYESTIQALDALYPTLTPGGFDLVDDYHVVAACKKAITDFRTEHRITAPIREIDASGVSWRK